MGGGTSVYIRGGQDLTGEGGGGRFSRDNGTHEPNPCLEKIDGAEIDGEDLYVN